eukprot:PhM_4_TR3656/c0_g2_i1/m.23774/K00774/PARP16; poly [ADP-ribose] polymerase 16
MSDPSELAEQLLRRSSTTRQGSRYDGEYYLRTLKAQDAATFLSRVCHVSSVDLSYCTPQHVLSVERRVEEIEDDDGCEHVMAFHGSGVENWYNICLRGLRAGTAGGGMFGDGIYLSTSLRVATDFTKAHVPAAAAANAGSPWSSVRIIGVFRVAKNDGTLTTGQRAGVSYEPIPPKYLLVTKPRNATLTHLLLYVGDSCPQQGVASPLRRFLSGYGMLLFYAVFVVALCLSSPTNRAYFYQFMRKVNLWQK